MPDVSPYKALFRNQWAILVPQKQDKVYKHMAEQAKRDPEGGTPANWFSVNYEMVRALAETAAEGDKRYGPENWKKGLKASNLVNHAAEHIFKMLDGDTNEPHLEHAMWNLGALRWMAKNHPDLVDVPAVRRYFKLGPPPVVLCPRCNTNPVDPLLGGKACAGCYLYQTVPHQSSDGA